MITLDFEYLDDLGLADLPVDDKHSLLRSAYRELELKVGSSLVAGLGQSQLDEFERIIDGDEAAVEAVLLRCKSRIDASAQGKTPREVASALWLNEMRPDYRHIVRRHLQFITEEIRASASCILAQVGHQSG